MAAITAPLRVSSLLWRPTSFARTSRQLQTTSVVTSNAGRRGRKRVTTTTTTATTRTTVRPSALATRLHDMPHGKRKAALSGTRKQHTATPPDDAVALPPPPPPPPPYTAPSTGLLSYLPPSWVPYAELVRLDKPAGTYYLFLPCLFSTLLAAPLTHPVLPPSAVLATSGLFFTGAVIMRGAGCTVNDLWDRNLDPHVARTRLRPLARGALSVRHAMPYLGVQLAAGLAVLVQFPPICLFYGIPSLLLVATYPLAKRVTNYPQAVLGLTFSWGAMMGFPALGIDLLSHPSALMSAACLYGSCVAWTIVYDMIYAYQDIRDDAKAGIKSIALAQQQNAKRFLSAISAVQVGLLTGAGVAVGAGPVYFLGTVLGTAATSAYMIRRVRLNDVQDAAYWFFHGAWKWTGGVITFGLTAEYACHYWGFYDRTERETIDACPLPFAPPSA